MCRWELRFKPSKPAASWSAGGSVSAAALVLATSLANVRRRRFPLLCGNDSAVSSVDVGSAGCRWELRSKPSKPAASWLAGGSVAAAALVSATSLVTAGGDGRVVLWDTRRPARPVASAASPDGGCALACADQYGISPDHSLRGGAHTVSNCPSKPSRAQLPRFALGGMF